MLKKIYSSITKENIIYLGTTIVAMFLFIILSELGVNRNNQSDYIEEGDDLSLVAVEHIPIHHILNNQLSDLEETEKLDRQIEIFLKRWEITGASFALMKNEKLIYSKGYGWADKEAQDSMDVRHILRIASLSKLITAVGILKLEEQGKLNLADSVFGENGILNDSLFLKIRDKRAKKITIEHLLRHQAGFTLHRGDPMFSVPTLMKWEKWERPPTMNEMITYILGQRLGFTPGRSSKYSNIGYLILSKVIEKITNLSYEAYIQENVLHPAKCYDFHIAKTHYSDKRDNEVRYYVPSNEPLVAHYDGSEEMVERCYGGNDIESLLGAGAWVASPSELLQFIATIDGKTNVPDILSPESVGYLTDSGPGKPAIGWAKTNNRYWQRTGSFSGTSAITKYQSDGYAWVFITNTSSWKGSTFPRYIEYMVRKASQRIEEWPDRDLFNSYPQAISRKLSSEKLFTKQNWSS